MPCGNGGAVPGMCGMPVPWGSGGAVPGMCGAEELAEMATELEDVVSAIDEEVLGAGATLPVLPRQ